MRTRCLGNMIGATLLLIVIGRLNLSVVANVRADDRFFESRVRPLFVTHCFPCHNDSQADGGLSLEFREGWSDREVISPGEPAASLLLKAVRGEAGDLRMPPPGSDQKTLSIDQINDLERWIREGAADPRSRGQVSNGPARRPRQFRITDQDLQHWAYQPLSENHDSRRQQLSSSEFVDRLLTKDHALNGLMPLPMATPRELVRRAYFDLWGLPPEPEIVERFAADPSAAAWSALIERLLESRHYGERWGRFWLDWVRFAESNGYERDGPKPHAWRYRDYVIDSFHGDKPYDRFLLEQLAGDLWVEAESFAAHDQSTARREAIIATGFYRLHVWDDEPDSSQVAEFDDLDDVIVTTGAAIMGLTLGCARCHDHKFDPVSQADYYAFLDVFRDVDPYGLVIRGGGGRGTGRIETWLCSESELIQWRQSQQQQIDILQGQLETAAPNVIDELRARIENLQSQQPPFDQALSVQLRPGIRPATHVLARGDYLAPLQQVQAAYPEVFHRLGWSDRSTSALVVGGEAEPIVSRLDFAKWLTGKAQPLTARVLANRIWLNHFGQGIVETPDDFGYTGLPPSNRELLDFLASELIEQDWSIKSLHRTIMNSEAYRRSSSGVGARAEANRAVDSDNRWFWRQNLRRLDAESIRDSQLAYAGRLHPKSGGPSVFSDLPQEVKETANPVSLSFWGASPSEEQNCRSVYLFVKRSLKNPILEAFDFANSHSTVGQRPVTTVAPQALMLLNDDFVRRQAEFIAVRLMSHSNDSSQRIAWLWRLVWQRQPSDSELRSVLDFLRTEEDSRTEQERWVVVVRAILNSNETIYID